MDRIRIRGGRQLKGEIRISGSKNASLPLMVTALLSDKKLTLHNVPRLADITTMIQLLKQHGVEIGAAPGENGHTHGTTLTLQAAKISSTTAPYDIVRKMRASVLVLGALLAREGVARVSLPGGCAIGARPVDLHIAGLKAMGAQNRLIRSVFIFNGMNLIARGLLYGNLVGLGLCFIQDSFHLFRLNAHDYYMSYVPIEWNWSTVIVLNVIVFVVVSIVLLLPTRFITRIQPVQAIRFD